MSYIYIYIYNGSWWFLSIPQFLMSFPQFQNCSSNVRLVAMEPGPLSHHKLRLAHPMRPLRRETKATHLRSSQGSKRPCEKDSYHCGFMMIYHILQMHYCARWVSAVSQDSGIFWPSRQMGSHFQWSVWRLLPRFFLPRSISDFWWLRSQSSSVFDDYNVVKPGWCFGTCVIFPSIGGDDPIWL